MLSIAILHISNTRLCRLVIDVEEESFEVMSGDDFAVTIETAHRKHPCYCNSNHILVVPLCMGLVAVNFEPQLLSKSRFCHPALRVVALNSAGLHELRSIATLARQGRPAGSADRPEGPPAIYHAVVVSVMFNGTHTAGEGLLQAKRNLRHVQGELLTRQGRLWAPVNQSSVPPIVVREVAKPAGVTTRILATYASAHTTKSPLPPPKKQFLCMPPANIYDAIADATTIFIDNTELIDRDLVSKLLGPNPVFVRVACASGHSARWLASILASGLDHSIADRAEQTVRQLSVFKRLTEDCWGTRQRLLLLHIDFSSFETPTQWNSSEIYRWLCKHFGESLVRFVKNNSSELQQNTTTTNWMWDILLQHPFTWLQEIIVACKIPLVVWVHGLDTILVGPMATAGLYRNHGANGPLDLVIKLVRGLLFDHLVQHAGQRSFCKGIFSAGVYSHEAMWTAVGLDQVPAHIELLDLLPVPQSGSQPDHSLNRLRGVTSINIRDIATVIEEPRLESWCAHGLVDVSGSTSHHDVERPAPPGDPSNFTVYDPEILDIVWKIHLKHKFYSVKKMQDSASEQVTANWQTKFAAVTSSPLLRSTLFNADFLATTMNDQGWSVVDPVPGMWPRGVSLIGTMCDANETPASTATDLMVWLGALQPITTDQTRRYITTGRVITAILMRIYELHDPSCRIELSSSIRRPLTQKEAEGLIKPLLHETRSWLDGLTQKLYNEYAPTRSQADTSANPPNNEDELQIWLVTAMKHPTTGLIVSLRRKILAETQVDFESLFMTGMVEVLLCNGDQNLCLDWNIHIDLCSNCKLNIGGELKYIPRPWSTKFDKLGNPPAKYALSAIPWLTREHRAEFLPANNEAINDRKWTMAEPKLQTEGDYSPNMCKNGRDFPNPLTSLCQLRFSRHPEKRETTKYPDWDDKDIDEPTLLRLGQGQMSKYRDAFSGGLQPVSERADRGIRDPRYRMLEHTNDCKVYHFAHLLVFLGGGAILFRFNGNEVHHTGAELVVSDPFTPTLVTGRKSKVREAAMKRMSDSTWSVYKVPSESPPAGH